MEIPLAKSVVNKYHEDNNTVAYQKYQGYRLFRKQVIDALSKWSGEQLKFIIPTEILYDGYMDQLLSGLDSSGWDARIKGNSMHVHPKRPSYK